MSGTRQARGGFTQGQINDVERGHGASLRFASAMPGSRFRFDAGVARNRFEAPGDPQLAQGAALVPLRARSSDAAYVDAGYELLRPGGGPARGRAGSSPPTGSSGWSRCSAPWAPRTRCAPTCCCTRRKSRAGGARCSDRPPTPGRTTTSVASRRSSRPTPRRRPGTSRCHWAPLRARSTPASAWWPVVAYTVNRTSQVGGPLPGQWRVRVRRAGAGPGQHAADAALGLDVRARPLRLCGRAHRWSTTASRIASAPTSTPWRTSDRSGSPRAPPSISRSRSGTSACGASRPALARSRGGSR